MAGQPVLVAKASPRATKGASRPFGDDPSRAVAGRPSLDQRIAKGNCGTRQAYLAEERRGILAIQCC